MKKIICFFFSLFFVVNAFAYRILTYEEYRRNYHNYEVVEKRYPDEIRRAYNDYVQNCNRVIAALDRINKKIERSNSEMNNLSRQIKQYTQNISTIRNEINKLNREEGNDYLLQQKTQELKRIEEERDKLSSQIRIKEEELRELQIEKAKLSAQLQ